MHLETLTNTKTLLALPQFIKATKGVHRLKVPKKPDRANTIHRNHSRSNRQHPTMIIRQVRKSITKIKHTTLLNRQRYTNSVPVLILPNFLTLFVPSPLLTDPARPPSTYSLHLSTSLHFFLIRDLNEHFDHILIIDDFFQWQRDFVLMNFIVTSDLPSYRCIKMIFYCVVRPAHQELRDFRPVVSHPLLIVENNLVLALSPFPFAAVRVKVIGPSFSALFACTVFDPEFFS